MSEVKSLYELSLLALRDMTLKNSAKDVVDKDVVDMDVVKDGGEEEEGKKMMADSGKEVLVSALKMITFLVGQ